MTQGFSLTATWLVRTQALWPSASWFSQTSAARTSKASLSGPRSSDLALGSASPPVASQGQYSFQPPPRPIPPVKVLKRITRAYRYHAGMKLGTIVEGLFSMNDIFAWESLLHFSAHCLR